MFIRDEDGNSYEEEILESFSIVFMLVVLVKNRKIPLLRTIIRRIAINEMIPSKTIICQESYDTKNFLIYEGIFMERLREFCVNSCAELSSKIRKIQLESW